MINPHANISVFVPHIGCPNMCSFCNQRHITGQSKAPDETDVISAVNIAKESKNYNPENTEIAFFGGSFTAIDREYMLRLLKCAYGFVRDKTVSGIRISTRPDAINREILDILKEYGVTSIELGAQSLDDRVLSMNERGHTANDVYVASKLIKEHGFSLGLQMMTGLYGDSDETAINTAKEIIKLAPDTVRIYPTIVLKDTRLAGLCADGSYKPQTLENALSLCSKLLLMFENANIRVIRLGLHSIEEDSFVAGPWHPAFSELCQSEIYLKNALKTLKEKGKYILFVGMGQTSKMSGQKRKNIETLKNMGYICKVCEKSGMDKYEVISERG